MSITATPVRIESETPRAGSGASRLREPPGLDQTRLVAVTGYGQASDRIRASAASLHEHLVKPVDLDVVEQLVARYCPGDGVG